MLAACQDPIGRLLLSETYRPAFRVVPVIALAYAFSLGLHFLETKFYAFRQTKYILWHSVAGAAANVLLNWWWMPQFGIIGAAWAMVGSCGCQFAIGAFLFGRGTAGAERQGNRMTDKARGNGFRQTSQ